MKKYVIGTMALATVATLMAAVPAFAETNKPINANVKTDFRANMPGGPERGRSEMMGGGIILGTVSTINGNTITVLGHTGFGVGGATTTFTVDATNAKVTKNNATSTVASIITGDTVTVQGKITGTSIVAVAIRDGAFNRPGMGFGRDDDNGQGKIGTSTRPIIAGNGQPIVAGTISAINGSIISIGNNGNTTYTVDTTNAKIIQGKDTITVSGLKTGDMVVVQGTINGTSVTASSVIDQAKPANSGNNNAHPGFFGGIGQFFMHMFGF